MKLGDRMDAMKMADAIRELDPFCGLFNIPCWFDDDYIIQAIAIEIGALRKPCSSYPKHENNGGGASA